MSRRRMLARRVFVDTGAYGALANAVDTSHRRAVGVAHELVTDRLAQPAPAV